MYLPTYKSIYLSIYLSICLYVFMYRCLSACVNRYNIQVYIYIYIFFYLHADMFSIVLSSSGTNFCIVLNSKPISKPKPFSACYCQFKELLGPCQLSERSHGAKWLDPDTCKSSCSGSNLVGFPKTELPMSPDRNPMLIGLSSGVRVLSLMWCIIWCLQYTFICTLTCL